MNEKIDSNNDINEISTITTNIPEAPASETKIDTTQSIDTMKQVFASAQKFIDVIPQHNRITITDLVDKVAGDTQLKHNVVNVMVNMFIEECVENKVGEKYIGANGGFYKGSKKPHIDNRPRCEACKQVIIDRSSYHKTFTSSNARAKNQIRMNEFSEKKIEEIK